MWLFIDVFDKAGFEKDKGIEKGDFVDLSTLLFTTNRDYLVKYNHPQLVCMNMIWYAFTVMALSRLVAFLWYVNIISNSLKVL